MLEELYPDLCRMFLPQLSNRAQQGATYVEAGVAGAKALGSQRRYNEAYDNFKQMAILWPQEKRMKELRDVFAS
jgi:hypothetical protein